MQVLLNDSSTFTVGANSDLVIDSFVYDRRKKSGKVVASFSKGVMRFVGGKISKNVDDVSIKTSAGALAIRGGMVQGWMNGKKGTKGQEFLPVDWLRERFPALRNVPDRFFPDIILSSETETLTNFDLGFLGNGDNFYINDDTFLALGNDGSTNVVRHASTSGIITVGQFKFLGKSFGPYQFSHPFSNQLPITRI